MSTRRSDGERQAPRAPLPEMVPCPFCSRSVDREELAAARHLVFSCPKVPEQIKARALALPDVVPPPPAEAGPTARPGGYGKRSTRAA